jgi:hypothetical protein
VAVYGAGAILVCLLMNTANILASLTHVFDDSVSTRRTGDSPWLFYGPEWTDLEAAAAWLGERAEPGARVATDASHYFFLLSGLETIMPPMVSRPEDAQHLLDGAAVRYLVLGSLDSPGFARRYMEPVLDAFPGLWRPIFTIADTATVVYERVDDLTNRDP